MAILLALSLTVLAGIVGLALDTTRQNHLRSVIQGAVDAAALAAVTEDAAKLSKGERRKLAEMYFYANCGSACDDIKKVKVKFEDDDFTVNVTTDAEIPTSLGRVLGFDGMKATATSTARFKKDFVDIHLVLDVSESMNIGTTEADIERLMSLLPDPWGPVGCMFACHVTHGWAEYKGQTYYEIARDNNIPLRQDHVRDSAKQVIDTLRRNRRADQFRVGVMTFNTKLKVQQEPTSDLNQAEAALSSISGTSSYTNMRGMLQALKTAVGSNGDGTPDNPTKIVILATDGVHNYYGYGPLNPDQCADIKEDGGTRMVVLNLVYPPMKYIAKGHAPYRRVGRYYDQLPINLAECASPGMYFEASDGEAITEAFEEIANAIVAPSSSIIR